MVSTRTGYLIGTGIFGHHLMELLGQINSHVDFLCHDLPPLFESGRLRNRPVCAQTSVFLGTNPNLLNRAYSRSGVPT